MLLEERRLSVGTLFCTILLATYLGLKNPLVETHDSPFGMALFNGASIAQMGAGLDHEIRLDLEIGPITIYILSWNMKP